MNRSTSQLGQKSLRSEQLAVISKGFFDVPPRTRNLMIVAGMCGIVIVFVASLMGNKAETVAVDKILHFSGYFVLAFVLVLGLPPKLYIPALVALAGFGYLIEVLQPLNGRSKDFADFVADCIGLGAGAIVGLIARTIYAFLRKELTTAAVRRRLRSYPAGVTIVREGARLTNFYIIKSGRVRLLKRIDKQDKVLTTLGPGEVIGGMGIVQGTSQYSTVEAVEPTTVYGMNLSELMDSAGGPQQPVSLVLATFADKLQELVDQLNDHESTPDH